jgi:hypothetical protein
MGAMGLPKLVVADYFDARVDWLFAACEVTAQDGIEIPGADGRLGSKAAVSDCNNARMLCRQQQTKCCC